MDNHSLPPNRTVGINKIYQFDFFDKGIFID